MDDTLKHRIIGGVILAASAAIFLPIFFKGSHHHTAQVDKRHEFEIPSTPAQPEIAFEDPPKVSEPMEPINELADSANAKTNPQPADALELANADEPATPPIQAAPAAEQAAPQVASIEASPVAVTPAVAPAKEKLHQQIAEEEPSIENSVAALPTPTHHAVSKPKLAAKAHAKPVIAKAEPKVKASKSKMELAHATRPHVYTPVAHTTLKPPLLLAKPELNGAWVVQCASFASSDHATALQAKLNAAGFNAYIKNAQTAAGAAVSRVYVGPQSNRVTAEALQYQLMAKANTKGILVNATALNG